MMLLFCGLMTTGEIFEGPQSATRLTELVVRVSITTLTVIFYFPQP